MAYVFKLPPTVTEEIMRNVVGYPRDRIRDMMSTVARAILDGRFGRPLAEWGPYHVTWRYKRYSNDDDCDYHVMGFNPESMDMTIDDDREGSYERLMHEGLKRLAHTCDACEPYSLQLQRTKF